MLEGLELVSQGAEAKIYRGTLFGQDAIVKERFAKEYRHPDLDRQLRQKQFGNELRSILRCSKVGLRVATVLWADVPTCRLWMKRIQGETVKAWLVRNEREGNTFDNEECRALAKQMGKCVAKIHDAAGMVHGDLTTSNFMISPDKQVWVLDFGLSYQTTDEEDFAVDLYVLERAMLSAHPNSDSLFARILKSYQKSSPAHGQSVIKRLANVRQRGRKKIAFG